MKFSSVLTAGAVALAVLPLSACDGLKEAMTAHVDTVAQAGTQELSVEQLATLVAELNTEPRKDIAAAVANTWIDYQLLAQAAAKGDTLVDNKAIDASLWYIISNFKARRFIDSVAKDWGNVDSAKARAMYENGELLAASHILVLTQNAPAEEIPELRVKANHIQKQVNGENFARFAHEASDDPGSAQHGGSLGLFAKGMMVGPFETAILALKPGEISPVVETQYGYHIIRRTPVNEISTEELVKAASDFAVQHADSIYQAKLRADAKLEFRKDAATTIREVLGDPQGSLENKTVIATYTGAKFTAARLAEWLGEMPPQQVYQQRAQLANAPDSILPRFAESLITNELLVRAADNAKVGPTEAELTELRKQFVDVRREAWAQLGLDQKTLADSATDEAGREHYAVKRVNDYISQLARGEAPTVNVPPPIVKVLRDQSKVSINQAGLDRAVERASKLHAAKAAADSARKAGLPKSEVPMPEPQSTTSNTTEQH